MTHKLKHIKKVLSKWWVVKECDEVKNMLLEKEMKNIKNLDVPEKKQNIYCSVPNVFKSFIKDNFDVEEMEISIDYIQEKPEEATAMFFGKYIELIAKLIKGYKRVIYKTKKDFPLWVEVKDFVVVLAPMEDGLKLEE